MCRADQRVLPDGPEAGGKQDPHDHEEQRRGAGDHLRADIFTACHAAAEDRIVEAILLPGQRPARNEDDHVHPNEDVGGVDAVEHAGGDRLLRLHALEREHGEEGADAEEATAQPRAPQGAEVQSGEDENRLPARGQAPRQIFF